MSIIFVRSVLSRLLKIITSSIRFRNSGEIARFSAFSINPVTMIYWHSLFVAAKVLNPIPASTKSFKSLAPIFDVMIIIVFLKLTFLPKTISHLSII